MVGVGVRGLKIIAKSCAYRRSLRSGIKGYHWETMDNPCPHTIYGTGFIARVPEVVSRWGVTDGSPQSTLIMMPKLVILHVIRSVKSCT